MDNPCKKDCPDRMATCHCECERYKKFRARVDERNRRRNKELENRPFSHDLEMKYRKKLKSRRARA